MSFALPPKFQDPLRYTGEDIATIPGVNFPRAPTTTDRNYPLFTIWRNSNRLAVLPDAEGDVWILIRFDGNTSPVSAIWKKLATGTTPGGTVLSISDTASTKTFPDSTGNIQLVGAAGQINVVSTPASNLLTISLAGGSAAIDSVQVDASTAPGTNPVLPTALGLVTVTGAQVAAGTVGANVIRTDSLAANTYTIEVQRSTTNATTDSTKNGVSHFASSQFSVDANGFVQLSGGSAPATQKFDVDAHTAPGTDPVVPDGSGVVIVSGAVVVAGTTPVRTDSLAANKFTVEVQTSQAIAAADNTKVGLCNFDNSQFTVDSNGFVQIQGDATASGLANIGIGYSSPTFTVSGYDGSALSSSNPGIVWLQDKNTPGRLKRYTVTANQTFTDGAAGTTVTQRFNFTAGVNYSNDYPFFLYAVGNDAQDTIAFMISRVPHATISPAAASIGKSGAIVNTGQGDFFSLANITVADYDANPCVCIGSFRMQFVGATNSWTVQAISNNDGIGIFQENVRFTVPKGVFSNVAAKYYNSGAGTEPSFTSESQYFWISRNGMIRFQYIGYDCSVAGTNAVALTMNTPFNVGAGAAVENFRGTGMCFTQTNVLGGTMNIASVTYGPNNKALTINRQGDTDVLNQNQVALTWQLDIGLNAFMSLTGT